MAASKRASALLIAALFCLVVSLSIAAPILVRPFYYVQINALHLPEETGWSQEVIRQAYDEVLDFCVFGRPFGTGQLAWSEAGRSHFADVQTLFQLDLLILLLSATLVAVLLLLRRCRRFSFYRFWGRSPAFWAGAGTAVLFTLVGLLAALDFDRAFTVFHSIFFPGKSNWIFDAAVDQIILVMPQTFFRNCAILIIALLLSCCAALIAGDLLGARRRRTAATIP